MALLGPQHTQPHRGLIPICISSNHCIDWFIGILKIICRIWPQLLLEFLKLPCDNKCESCTVQFSIVKYSEVHYSTVQYNTIVKYSTVVQYSIVQCRIVQYNTMKFSIVQYSTVQYSTVHYCNVFYCNFSIFISPPVQVYVFSCLWSVFAPNHLYLDIFTGDFHEPQVFNNLWQKISWNVWFIVLFELNFILIRNIFIINSAKTD